MFPLRQKEQSSQKARNIFGACTVRSLSVLDSNGPRNAFTHFGALFTQVSRLVWPHYAHIYEDEGKNSQNSCLVFAVFWYMFALCSSWSADLPTQKTCQGASGALRKLVDTSLTSIDFYLINERNSWSVFINSLVSRTYLPLCVSVRLPTFTDVSDGALRPTPRTT